MYGFLLFISITLQAANAGPPRTIILKSDDQYSPPVCEKRAQEAVTKMEEVLSKSIPGARIEIEHRCVLLETRKI